MRTRGSAWGFTLIEATIAVAIMALVAGVTIPIVGNSTRADLRMAAAKIAGTVRGAYARAALTGQTHRLMLVFDGGAVKVEATEQLLSLDEGSDNVLVRGAQRDAGGPDLFALLGGGLAGGAGSQPPLQGLSYEEQEEAQEETVGALRSLLNLGDVEQQDLAGAFTDTGLGFTLPDGVRFMDVWVQGMPAPQTEGTAQLYFFPGGYTQEALVHLEDGGGNVFSVKVAGLTGKARIEGEYVEVPK